MSKPRLQTLKPRVTLIDGRLSALPAPSQADGYRLRGRAGVAARDRIRCRDNGLCQACLERGLITLGTQVDHIMPLHRGGPDTDANKRLLCHECHAAKTANDLRL